MNKYSSDELSKMFGDFSYAVGQTLVQVSVGVHQLQLHFQQGMSISVESRVAVEVNGRTELWTPGQAFTAVALFELLHLDISNFEVSDDAELHLFFGEIAKVSIGVNESFESYQIAFEGDGIII